MKVIYRPSNNDIRKERKKRYLEKWPIEKQLEAFSEAFAGRNEKTEELLKDFADIRKALPFCKESD